MSEAIYYECLEDFENIDGYFVEGQIYEFLGKDGDNIKLVNEDGIVSLVPGNCFERVFDE